MRITAFCLSLCLLLLAPVFAHAEAAQSGVKAARPTAEAPPLHPALWKVTRGNTTIWLFGTIHMLPPGANWINGMVAQAADGADEIATEIDDPDGTLTRAAIAVHGSLPAGEHLSDLIPATERAAVSARLGGFPAVIDSKKPWFAAVALSTVPLLRRGFNRHSGVEAQLHAREAARNVRRVGIETPEDQIALLDSLTRPAQLAYLKGVIDDFDKINGQIDAMIAAWGKGDADGLARLMIEDEGKDDPQLIDRLMTQRNRHFAAWVADRLTRPGHVFMAIGAGHLAGADSVQDNLAKAGIKVDRVQ
jgi:uncharacterized protein YbaP (TraB family)